jgi:glycosyltransferase 2 family protein
MNHGSRRRVLAILVKAAISGALLWLSIRTVSLEGVGQRISGLDVSWLVLMLLLFGVQMPVLALRWHEIAAVCGADLPASVALRYTLIGTFFTQVLPSTAGGDAARIFLMARRGGWQTAIYSVLIDRLVGVTTMAVLVVLCMPFSLALIHDATARLALLIIGFGTLGAVGGFLCLGFIRPPLIERWRHHLAAASRVAWRLCRCAAGARILGLAIVTHFLTVTIIWAATRATHDSADFVQVLFLVLPVFLVAAVPISIAGWGIRESSMVLAFTYAGLPQADGLIVSLLYGVNNLAVGICGGLVWIADGHKRHARNIGDSTGKDHIDLMAARSVAE